MLGTPIDIRTRHLQSTSSKSYRSIQFATLQPQYLVLRILTSVSGFHSSAGESTRLVFLWRTLRGSCVGGVYSASRGISCWCEKISRYE
jgi:hypothetical protein